MDDASVAEAVAVVGSLLQADGAAISLVAADPKRARIELTLDLRNVACMDCVVPPDLLHEMVETAFANHLHEELEVVVNDPRRAAP